MIDHGLVSKVAETLYISPKPHIKAPHFYLPIEIDPLKKHYKLRFLEDFKDLIGLDKLDPNYIGMIDQIVASRGRDFVGTYFSSLSAYIGRMRGYRYISGKRMFYSHPDYWNETHSWGKTFKSVVT